LHLGNVELRRNKPNMIEKRTKTGINKVIEYALWERGLANKTHKSRPRAKIIEGTRAVPEFGRPISDKGAKFLVEKADQHNQRLAPGRREAA
jgi:actin-related protein 6